MKSGPEIVKAGLRSFFESASEDIEKMVENLKLGKVTQSRTQVKGVAQNINYTTVALLPVLTSLFEHVAQHNFGDDVIREPAGMGADTMGMRGHGTRQGCGTWGDVGDRGVSRDVGRFGDKGTLWGQFGDRTAHW